MRRAICGAVAPFLILVAPFAVFLQYHGYGFLRAEVAAILFIMAALALVAGAAAAIAPAVEGVLLAGLLTLFVDLQFDPPKGSIGSAFTFLVLNTVLWFLRGHAVRVVTLMMGTVLVSALLLPRSSGAVPTGAVPASTSHRTFGSDTLPLILHLILDEHIGFEGMPPGLTPPAFEREVRSFYDRHGFRLFARAYSEHWDSHRSVPHVLNLLPGRYLSSLVAEGTRSKWIVTTNAYFERLAQWGYSIRVHQSDYLDLCAGQLPAPRCQTYAATSLAPFAQVALPASQKGPLVAGMYLMQSNLYLVLRGVYNDTRRQLAPVVALPSWSWEQDRIGPVSSMPVVDALASDLRKARPGDFVMAHLLMPHYPYVYGANCELRQPGEWLDRSDDEPHPGAINTPDSRATRYARYFEQASCVQKKLEQLMMAIPPSLRRDAIVIIHGDHGSRISLVEPTVPGRDRLSATDFADSYSTLFAVRSPHLEPGYHRRLAPITCLMRTLVESQFHSVSAVERCATTPTVFVSADDPTVAMPFPAFGQPPRDGAAGTTTEFVSN